MAREKMWTPIAGLNRVGGRHGEASACCFAVKGGANSKDKLIALRPRLVYTLCATLSVLIVALVVALAAGVGLGGGAGVGAAATLAASPAGAAALPLPLSPLLPHAEGAPSIPYAPRAATPTPPSRAREAFRRAMGICAILERFIERERPATIDRQGLVAEIGMEVADLEVWALEAQRNISVLGGVDGFLNAFDRGFARRRRETLHRVERAVDAHWIELGRKRDAVLDVISVIAGGAFYPELESLSQTLKAELAAARKEIEVQWRPRSGADGGDAAASAASGKAGGASARVERSSGGHAAESAAALQDRAASAAAAAAAAAHRIAATPAAAVAPPSASAAAAASPRDLAKLATFFKRVERLRGVAFPNDMRQRMEVQIERLRSAVAALDPLGEDYAFEAQTARMHVLRDLRKFLKGSGIVGVNVAALNNPQQVLGYIRELVAVVRLKEYAEKLLALRDHVDKASRSPASVLMEIEQMVVDGLIPHDLLQPETNTQKGGVEGLAWMVG